MIRITQVPSLSFGWAGAGNKVPASGTAGRAASTPLSIYLSCAGDDTAGMISRARANPTFNPPAAAPTVGIPHFHIAYDGAIYQFVALSNAAWAIEPNVQSPVDSVAVGQGTVNPNLYGVFITYESGAPNSPSIIGSPPTNAPNFGIVPTPSQVEAFVDLIRYIRTTLSLPSLGFNTYNSVNIRYSCASTADLLTAITDGLAEPIPPDCNAELCIFDEENPAPDGATVILHDPITRCPVGMVATSGLVPPSAEIAYFISNNDGVGLTNGTPTAYASTGYVNSTAETVRVMAVFEAKVGGEFDATVGDRQISNVADFQFGNDGLSYSSIASTGQAANLFATSYHNDVNENAGASTAYIMAAVQEVAFFNVPPTGELYLRARLTPYGAAGSLDGLGGYLKVALLAVRSE